MATEATSGFMGIEAAASELQTNALAVKRLVARERLSAVQLGPGGAWRVSGAELGRFIGAGAPDLKMPHIVHGWFDPDDTSRAASEFQDSFIQAASWGLGDTPPAGEGPFEIKAITPAMFAAMTGAPAKRYIARKDAPTFVDAFHVWAVERVRAIVDRLLTKTGRDKLAALYATPEDYAKVTAEAVAALLKSSIRFRHTFPGDFKSYEYSVPVSIMLTTARRAQILQSAF